MYAKTSAAAMFPTHQIPTMTVKTISSPSVITAYAATPRIHSTSPGVENVE